jgi:glycosyltransferase involved in cell wall biosynthesis
MNRTRVLVAQLGARKHYQEPALFHNWGVLDGLYTDFYCGHNPIFNFLRKLVFQPYLPNMVKKILDRYDPGLSRARIVQFPTFGYHYLKKMRQSSPEKAAQVFIWGGKTFCQHIIEYGLGTANTIYGFNSACLELFEYAKQREMRCILDQTLADSAQVYQLLLDEEQRWPGWSVTPFRVNTADRDLMYREQREQDIADAIVCGSEFVADSLSARGVDAKKISIIPLGRLKGEVPQLYLPNSLTSEIRADGLKILFVGSVGLRKGIPYLLQALRNLKGNLPFTCKVAGTVEINPARVIEYQDVCEFLGRVPRSQVKDLYGWADVFVLPSICEGSAMVTYEALSLGIPVITTHNSGSVVRDGIDGWVVPIRDSEAISRILLKLYQEASYLNRKVKNKDYLNQLLQNSEHKLRKIIVENC